MGRKYDAPIQGFLSSAPEDEFWREELKKSLKGLQHKITFWDDSQVKAGDEQKKVIREHVNDAHLILLLMSKEFLNSENCEDVMLWAMKRQTDSEVRVIPIILSAVDYTDLPIRDLKTLPKSALPITSWENRSEAFHQVAIGIREVVEELLNSGNSNISSSSDITLANTHKLSNKAASGVNPQKNPSEDAREYEYPRIPPVPQPLSTDEASFANLADKLITHNRKGCIFQLKPFMIILLIITIAATIIFARVYLQSAIVTITPKSSEQNGNYAITAVTSTPDTTKQQVQARQLSYTTPPQSEMVSVTGIFQNDGLQATGKLTFYNGMVIPQTVKAGTVFTDKNGVQIVNDVDATIPAAEPPKEGQITVNAHAVTPGLSGDIAALAINVECCTSSHTIFVRNLAPFTGGRDVLSYTFVQQSDIGNAASSLVQSLTPSAQSSLQSQVHANEALTTKPECTNKLSSNHHAGDKVDKVAVTVVVTCICEVYDKQAVDKIAINLLKQDAVQKLGTNYALAGKTSKITVTQATAIDAKEGTATIQVKVEGLWVYQFDVIQKQKLSTFIVGKTQQDASKVLKQQTGVAEVQIDAGIGNLPTDPAKISIEIVTPAEKTKT